MTFCVAIQVRDGLVALSDTQIVKGPELSNKRKLSRHSVGNGEFFLTSSGMRSIRDKALVYLENELSESGMTLTRLYEVANVLGVVLQRVRAEDGPALQASNLAFNAHFVIGGRLPGDADARLFYVYPEGNWIESSVDAPYFIAGRTYYAKPILDRLLTHEVTLVDACAVALLAFDMTRTSVNDVGFPVDVIVFSSAANEMRHQRFSQSELQSVLGCWQDQLAASLVTLPMGWADPLLIPRDDRATM